LAPKLRKYSHEYRLKIACQITDRVVKKYGKKILAVYICGSTSKRLDRPYSDLEMIVVVRDRVVIPMKYYLHQGLIINIEYLTSRYALDDAEKFEKDWHWVADQYRNRIPLYERDGWFRRLDEAVAKNDKKDSSEAIVKAFVMLTESMAVMRNAILTNDNIGVQSSRRVVAEDAARIVYLLNRRYVTTTSWFWKILFDLQEKPEDFNSLIKKIAGFVPTTTKGVVVSSERLYREMSELLANHGIKIEREHLLV
jgi:predicted nucleotidyltransferase